MESPFYRQNLGIPNYPGYSPSLLHPGLTGPTPFVPPNHLPAFQTKVSILKTSTTCATHFGATANISNAKNICISLLPKKENVTKM